VPEAHSCLTYQLRLSAESTPIILMSDFFLPKEPLVLMQPQLTRVEGVGIVMQSCWLYGPLIHLTFAPRDVPTPD
jgi:hypothetical protein